MTSKDNSSKCIVLFSGGLDSRLALKIMQEKGYETLAVFFKLPFSKNLSEDDKEFLKTAKAPFKTDSLLAPSPAKFLRQVENQFVNTVVRKQRKLTDTEFDNQKNSFLNDSDMKQIILCLNLLKDKEKVVLVTEETESSNDNKLFKKIPAICKELNIETLTLPELLAKYDVIDIDLQ